MSINLRAVPYRVLLDGKAVGTFDLLNAKPTPSEDALGRHTLKAGEHALRFECVGHNSASKGYLLGLDCLQARVPVYARPEGKDLRDIQVKAAELP